MFNINSSAEAQGWVEDLVRAARESNSENLQLRAIAQELLTSSPSPG
ncbi:effector-associated domain EAD1-containing protein [Scytonema sp. NUACC26]